MKNVFRLFAITTIIMVAVLLIMVINDLFPRQPIEVVITPDMIILPEHGSYNESQDGWAETANAYGVHPDSMTSRQYAMPEHYKQD